MLPYVLHLVLYYKLLVSILPKCMDKLEKILIFYLSPYSGIIY